MMEYRNLPRRQGLAEHREKLHISQEQPFGKPKNFYPDGALSAQVGKRGAMLLEEVEQPFSVIVSNATDGQLMKIKEGFHKYFPIAKVLCGPSITIIEKWTHSSTFSE